MQIPENNVERLAAIKTAGERLAASIFPNSGYNPGEIGKAFADSLITSANSLPVELDLAHECLEIVLSAAMSRMSEHFKVISDAPTFDDVKLPIPAYDVPDDDDDDERMEARERESRQ